MGAVALVGAALPGSAVMAGETPDGIDADAAGRDAASAGAAKRHANDPRVQLRELFGLDASPGRIAELMADGYHDPQSPWLATPQEKAQIEAQLAAQERLALVQGDIHDALGAAYGGVEIDQTVGGEITVRVAGDGGEVEALIRALVPTAGDVRVQDVDYGLDELEALAEDVNARAADVEDFVGAAVNESENRVDVSVLGLDKDARDELSSTISDDPRLEAVEATRVEPTSNALMPGHGTRWDNTQNMLPVGVGNCSIAFGVRGTTPATAGNYAVTAGHCMHPTQLHRSRTPANFVIGTGAVRTASGTGDTVKADVALIRLAQGVTVRNNTKYISELKLNAPNLSPSPVGTVACKWGSTTGLSCGTVSSVRELGVYMFGIYPVLAATELNRVTYASNTTPVAAGDSGGLVFALGSNQDARVLGVVNGGSPNGGLPGQGWVMPYGGGSSNEMYYSDWGSSVAELGPNYAFGNK